MRPLDLDAVEVAMSNDIVIHEGDAKDGKSKSARFDPWRASYFILHADKKVRSGVLDPSLLIYYYNKL